MVAVLLNLYLWKTVETNGYKISRPSAGRLLFWRQCFLTTLGFYVFLFLSWRRFFSLCALNSTDSSWKPRSTPHWTDPTLIYGLMERSEPQRWMLWVWIGCQAEPLVPAPGSRNQRSRGAIMGGENSSIWQLVCCSSREAQCLTSLWFEEEENDVDVALGKNK